ncbi:T9SS sorting signal type C domain-containing protein [uncultured Flavobacterium sp.]|uniref:T9SS sorting signal type C domain-containing protein n=1 Tax=uncultured Flavobacterium sp. TaxID=165435 RepID=UPI0025E9260B|nr:T9SS sorting signal type C domain-containing protein [uncultured Flavobacterium sp.]
MKTLPFYLVLLLLPALGFSQGELVKWTGVINSQPSTAPTVVANYIAADAFAASSNVNLTANWQGFETSGWGDGATVADYSKYYQMSVRPTTGASMTVTKIRFKYQGEYKRFEVRYAKNAGFTGSVSLGVTNPAISTNTGTQKDLNVNIPVLAGERLYVRVYVYDRAGNTTWRILHTNGDHVPPTIIGTVTAPQPLSGTYTIGQALSNDFKTISDAAAAVNSIGVKGAVTFLLNDAVYNNTLGENFPITFNQFAGTSAANTVTIRPNTGVNARIDAFNANGTVPVQAVFKMNGADNIVIDGSNIAGGTGKNLIIDNNGQLTYTNRSVIYLASPTSSNAPENVTIRNTVLQQSYTNGDSFFTMGVYVGQDTSANSSLNIGTAAAKVKNLTVSNVTFLNVKEGVYILDNNATSSALQNVVVEKSIFGGATNEERTITAIYMSNLNGFTIAKNTITGVFRNHNNGDLGFAGIQIAGNSTNGTIAANNLSQIEKTVANGVGIAGINLSSTSTNTNITVVNNFILDVIGPGNGGENQNGFGIGIFSGRGYKLYHNTVKLSKKQYNNAGISAALFIENNVLNLDVRNNMFINTQPVNGARFAIYVAASGQTTFATLNNNNYYSVDKMGSIGSFYTVANIKTFAQWKAATGKDGASTTIMPTFVSSEDLHLAPFAVANMSINAGQALNIANDIDGDSRSLTAPYVGADEFGSTGCQYATTYNADGTWSNGFPDSSKAVIINGTFAPTTDIEACSLTVTATGSIIMPVGKNLFVVNQIDIAQGGVLVMNSNSDLVQINNVSNTGTATIKRHSSLIKRLDYTLWSSPVTGAQTLLEFSPMTLPNRFYTYNTHSNLYSAVGSPSTTTFALAKGYLIRTPNDHPANVPTVVNGVFSGTPNNGTITFPMAYEGPENGYNAVGNPYPSPINVADFIDANSNNIVGTLWFWRKTNDTTKSSYSTLTKFAYAANSAPGGENQYAVDPHGVLNTGQGFIVKAKSASNLVFTNKMRKANSSDQFFRSAQDNEGTEAEASRIWLNVTAEGDVFTQTVVGYTSEATLDIDNGIDGESFVDGDVNLYSIAAEKTLAIQGRPEFTAEDVVPMGFKTATAGTFVLSIDHMDGIFLGSQAVFIKDNLTGAVHNLKNGSYTFTSEIGTFDTRFEIVYADAALGTDNPVVAPSQVVIFQNAKQVTVTSPEIIKSVVVYDLLGKVIYVNNNVNAQDLITTSLPAEHQVVIVKATLENQQVINKKVLVN